MRVGNTDITISMANNAGQTDKNDEDKQIKNGVIYAKNLDIEANPVAKRKEEAKQEIKKILEKVYNSEAEIDDNLADRKSRIASLRDKNGELVKHNEELEAKTKATAADYGVTPESEEQADLELLKQRSDNRLYGKQDTFTEEELERLAKIDENGMTEYQSRAMELYSGIQKNNLEIKDNQRIIEGEVGTISAIKLERLKTRPLEDAHKEVEAAKEAASAEIVGMIIEEGKENIDKTQQEIEEKAEEKAEKEEELEEQIEAAAEKKEKAEESTTSDIVELDKLNDDVRREVKNIQDKMKLVEEDLLGMAVDKEV